MSGHIYKDYGEIVRRHGLFAVFGYWLSRLSGYIGPTRVFIRLPHWFPNKLAFAFDQEHTKSTPWWQDGCVLALSSATAIMVYTGFCNSARPMGCLWHFICGYIIIDKLGYHSGVLWFDDLRIGANVAHRKVWSHRRILFQAIINFLELIAIYAALYRQHMLSIPDLKFCKLFHYSFSVSTALSRPDGLNGPPNWLVDSQVAMSVFFLVVVISIVASVGYRRPEVAPSLDD